MHFPALLILVIVAIIANISYTNGATCLCSCCSGAGCTATSAGSITVSSCSSCANSLCQSTYSSTCVSVNGVTSSSCVQGNGAHAFFEPFYRALIMAMISLPVLVYQKIHCGRCAQTADCTHFTWTKYNDRTCWMKKGSVSKSDAFFTNDYSMVCGVIDASQPNPDLGPLFYGVLATRHGAYESGACALPAGNYAVTNPVALGNIDSLKHLKFQPELCGQVLRVDCGHGPLNIIITNSNYGAGFDLYASTWDKLTSNKPPGETSCSVQLTALNACNFNGPRCYCKPGTDFGNAYYHNVGLLNTSGRTVIRATIDNRPGEHRGDNPYYAFNFGPVDVNKQVIFTYDDGGTYSVFLRDCISPKRTILELESTSISRSRTTIYHILFNKSPKNKFW